MPGHACGDEITRFTLIRAHFLLSICIFSHAPVAFYAPFSQIRNVSEVHSRLFDQRRRSRHNSSRSPITEKRGKENLECWSILASVCVTAKSEHGWLSMKLYLGQLAGLQPASMTHEEPQVGSGSRKGSFK